MPTVAIVVVALGCGAVVSSPAGAASPPNPGPPVVVFVLDELSTGTLMTARGRIDGRRFPNFAALARSGTWYRNNTTVADATKSAVPAILTGRRPPGGGDGGPSIFTMLHGSHRLRGFESVTHFCPPAWCPKPQAARRLAGARLDARARGNFSLGRVAGALEQIQPGDKPLAWVTHVILPHVPWRFLPGGESYDDSPLPFPSLWATDGVDNWTGDEYGVALSQQRALLQVGFVDRVIGELRRRLEQAGIWEQAMVVVVADHGATFTALQPRRSLTPSTFGEMAMVPLFVKYPRQEAGRISDRSTNSAQILPTIARWTGAPDAYQGTTLEQAGYGADVVARSARRDANLSMPLSQVLEQRSAAIAQRERRLPWASLYRTSTGAGLVGRRLPLSGRSGVYDGSVHVLGRAGSRLRGAAPRALGTSYLTASVTGVARGELVAVAVDGRIVAVSRVLGYAREPEDPDGPTSVPRIAAMIDPHDLPERPSEPSFYLVRGGQLTRIPVR